MSYVGGFISRGEARRLLPPICRQIITLVRGTEGNHQSKHISPCSPFLFLPVCLSQGLAQVSWSGSSSLATLGWKGSVFKVRRHFFHSESWLHFYVLYCPKSPTPASPASQKLSGEASGDHWSLRGRLSPCDKKCNVCCSVLSQLGQGFHTAVFSCSGTRVPGYGNLLQISSTSPIALQGLGFGEPINLKVW